MARDDDGIPVLSPGECWIAALWTEGVALFVLGLIYDISAQDLSFFPCTVYAVGFCGLALFFAASVPSDGGSGTFLSPAALALMRVVPSPGLPIRLAAIVACVIPCFIWEWGGIDSASIWVFAFAGTLFVVTLLHGDRSAAKAGFVDNAAPCLMVGLTGAYGLSTWALYPADASYGALGMTLAGGAQLFLLRHAAARHWTALAVSARQERGVPDVTIPIEAYSTETELAVPAAPAASPAPGSGPTLVESGTFRIDASKLIEKLRERQLAEAGDFILAWLRCAVASGASAIRLEQEWDGYRMSFDGTSFSQAQLADPYRALLDPDQENAVRGAQFAYGLLAVLRMKPHAIWIFSGEKQERAMTRLSTKGSTDLPPPKDPGTGTQIAVAFGFSGLWRGWLANRRARAAWGMSAARLWVNGLQASSPQVQDGWSSFEQKGWRMAWRRLEQGVLLSRIAVYHLGTLIETYEEPLPLTWQREIALSHPDLTLSISQSSVVRNHVFERGLRLALELDDR